MKILYLTQQLGSTRSGIGTYSQKLARGMLERGHIVSIACPAAEEMKGFGEIVFRTPDLPFVSSHLRWIPLAKHFGSFLNHQETSEFDIIHFTDGREALFVEKKVAPIVGTMHDSYIMDARISPGYYRRHYRDWVLRWIYYNISKPIEKRAIFKLDKVICNTRFVEGALSSAYGIEAGKTIPIYYGIFGMDELKSDEADEGSSIEGGTGYPSLIFIGGNFQRKGLELVIRSLSNLAQRFPRMVLNVVGSDSNQEHFARLGERLGVGSRIKFHGYQNAKSARSLLRSSSVLVMPSLVEGFGMVYLEAMRDGVPAIGTTVGGARELIDHGRNGLLVNPASVEDLSRAILLVITDEESRNRIIEEGRRTVRYYTVERMCEETEEVYDRARKLR